MSNARVAAGLLPASALLFCFAVGAQAQTPQTLPVDQPSQVDGVQAACTGIGNTEEDEARWSQYPIKIETVGGYGQWLGDQDITVHGEGRDVSFHCSGPWLVMGLNPGHYRATITVPGTPPKDVSFTVPKQGQRALIVRFHEHMSGSSVRAANPM